MTIICDTNIWYGFAQKTVDINAIKDHQLLATYVSIAELASTPYLTDDTDLFVRTISELRKHYSAVIRTNPYEHLISIFFYDFRPDYSLANRILNGFDFFMSIVPDSIPEENIINTKRDIEKVIKERKAISDHINEGLKPIRRNIKKMGGKKYRRKINTISLWKKFISKTVLLYSKQFLNADYKIDIDDPSWKKIEFLLITFEEYFLMLEISGNRKFDKNDWDDLLNLVYVQPGMKYWTFESKWNNIFKDNEVLSKYLYEKTA